VKTKPPAKIFTFAIAIFALAVAGSLLLNCGRPKRGSNSGSSLNKLIPAGWDGQSDWEGSRWSIVSPGTFGGREKNPASNARRVNCRKRDLNDATYRVRIKFYQGGNLHLSLAGNPDVESLALKPSPEVSEAVIRLASASRLSELARMSHTTHHTGCTALEVISGPGIAQCDLQLSHPSATTIQGPEFEETISLDAVTNLLPSVSSTAIAGTMTHLQSLTTRYALGAGAATASTTVEQIFNSAGAGWGSAFTTTKVSHQGATSAQQSVVSTLSGANDDDSLIVIGSHLDSINPANNANAPGADDNASGVAVLTETMRILSSSGIRFKRRIEWHAYAAEELGLIGSGALAQSYASQGKKVAAMLQIDMASWATDPLNQTIHVVTSDTSTVLRRSVKDLLTTYLGGDFSELPLPGTGTSDHRSWYRAGFPTVFPFENPGAYNPRMHSSEDTVANANAKGLAVRMTKLVTTFLAHHAGISGSDSDYAAKIAVANRDPDIKIAVLEKDQIPKDSIPTELEDAGTLLVFSAPVGIEALEICNSNGSSSRVCVSDRTQGTKIESNVTPAGRSFFYAIFPASAHGLAERAFGYTSENKPTHARDVALIKK
jgi:Zn-dependent M28 family amino/carboxypeptidase